MIDIEELKTRTTRARAEVDRKNTEQRMYQDRLKSLQTETTDLQNNVDVLDRVTILLNSIGETRQQEAQVKIEGIVTNGLQTIFGDHVSFHINQSMKGKNASVDFSIRSKMGDSVVETPILESHGGGLASVVGFLLRVTVMLLDKGADSANVLVLDESFGMVSDEYLEDLMAFVKELVSKTGIQVILITHQKDWEEYADITHRFDIKHGETYLK